MTTLNTNADTVLLVGAGAVTSNLHPSDDSSWPVINKAINATFGPAHPVASNQENFALANLVFRLRFTHIPSEHPRSSEFNRIRDENLTNYNAAVANIADHLSRAQKAGEISLRKSFQNFAETDVDTSSLAVITTNWDTLLDEYFRDIAPVIHIHGSFLDKSLMLLPTEIVFENYRPREARAHLSARHNSILGTMERAKKIIIFGLSLSPLDAELNLAIGDTLSSLNVTRAAKQSVVVIDRFPGPVVERLRHFDPSIEVEAVVIE